MKFSYDGKTRNDVVQLRNSINSRTFSFYGMLYFLNNRTIFV